MPTPSPRRWLRSRSGRVGRRVWAPGVLLLATLAFAGCGGTVSVSAGRHTTTRQAAHAVAPVPRPNFAAVLPLNYRIKHVWYHALSNPKIPDAVVASVGPPVGSLSFHSADLQVLSWDPIARRWIVAFDAQKIAPPDTSFGTNESNSPITAPAPAASAATTTTAPLLDPKADIGVGQVAFVQFAPGQGTDLVFTATTSYGGSGVGSQLQVVSFKNQEATIVYSWDGEGLYPFKTVGAPPHQRLLEKAEFWTLEDAHCCPIRTYRFTVESRGRGASGYVADLSDQRPWLGISPSLSMRTGGRPPLKCSEQFRVPLPMASSRRET